MFKKNLQKIKFLIIVIVVFLLGIFAEKSKIDDKISQFLEERIDKIYQSFYSAFQEKKFIFT